MSAARWSVPGGSRFSHGFVRENRLRTGAVVAGPDAVYVQRRLKPETAKRFPFLHAVDPSLHLSSAAGGFIPFAKIGLEKLGFPPVGLSNTVANTLDCNVIARTYR